MMKMMRSFYIPLLLLIAACIAEDSLQGALKAVHRRQRDLSGNSRYDNYGNWDDYVDMAKYENRKVDLEKALYEYLENAQDTEDDSSSLALSSPFRERAGAGIGQGTGAGRSKSLALAPQQRSFRRPTSADDDYVEFLNADDSEPFYAAPYKRYSYNSLGYNGVGMRKRSRPFAAERSAISERYDDDYPGMYGVFKARERRVPFYPVTKRFPVAKRSMKMMKRTDPKVEKELSQLFNANKNGKDVQNDPKEVKEDKTKAKHNNAPNVQRATTAPSVEQALAPTSKAESTPEVDSNNIQANRVRGDQPLQMSKKSVKWSDYFGIDRRKKSAGGNMANMDNEWLLNRYHKAVDLAKEKKSEYPLKNFHKHDQPTAPAPKGNGNEKPTKDSNDSMEELDEKLRNIEESIIDDTLKFTGASGAQDDIAAGELRDVKDNIISRLATAYNVEKMRKALREYRQSLASRHIEEFEVNDALDMDEDEDREDEKEKRVAVPRKQAVDEERLHGDEDNNIKCTDNDEDCAEQSYKVPREFMEQATFEKGGCERIERACREVSLILGPYGSIFETACNMHQMCMLCSDNSWFSPTRQCNILFLSKADQLCDGDVGCQRGARESIKYLQHVDRNMRADLSVGCNPECLDRP